MKIKRLLYWAVTVFVLDQLTKFWVLHAIAGQQPIVVIPNFFELVYVTNRGAAFGIFANLPDPYRAYVLLGVSGIAVLLIFFYYFSLPAQAKGMQIALSLILGGAAGNLYDRFARGEVVDFLRVHWYEKWVSWGWGKTVWEFKLEWPSFNVADMAISLAVIWLLWALIKEERKTASAEEA